MLLIDPSKILMTVVDHSNCKIEFPLHESQVPLNLNHYSKVKPSGYRYLDIQAVKVKVSNTLHLECKRHIEYDFAQVRTCSPLVNPDATKFCAGFSRIRRVDSWYEVDIPITEHVVFMKPKSKDE